MSTQDSAKKPARRPTFREKIAANSRARRERVEGLFTHARSVAAESVAAGKSGSAVAEARLRAAAAAAATASQAPRPGGVRVGYDPGGMSMGAEHFASRHQESHQFQARTMPSRDPAAPSFGPGPSRAAPPESPQRKGGGGMSRTVDPAAPTYGHLQAEEPEPHQIPAQGHGGLTRTADPAAPTFGHLQKSRAPAEPAHHHPVTQTHVDPLAPAVYQKK